MRSVTIAKVVSQDRRFPLRDGAGSDAVHNGVEYAFAVTRLYTDREIDATGITLTLGNGNQLVCDAIELLGAQIAGREIHELMANFGDVSQRLADDPALRWLGPHKGVIHLALASLVNACFDLWAKARGVPLWRLLLDLTPEAVVALLDFKYVEDVLTPEQALAVLVEQASARPEREVVLSTGYPGYDTSVGWFQYEDAYARGSQGACRGIPRFQAQSRLYGWRTGYQAGTNGTGGRWQRMPFDDRRESAVEFTSSSGDVRWAARAGPILD